MKRLVLGVAVATLLLVIAAALASSTFPDGLERVAAMLGFGSRSSTARPASPLANYETRYFRSRWAAQITAGLLGAALVWAFGVLFGRTLKRKR